MKKLYLAVLLVLLGTGAILVLQPRHDPSPYSSSILTSATTAVSKNTSRLTKPAPVATTNTITAGTLSATPQVQGASTLKRAWDYSYFASLTNAQPGGTIRFELVGGTCASGTIRHVEYHNGELIYITGVVTAPEAGRFFFQKQTLPGKQGDFAGLVEFPSSKTAWRIEPTGPGRTSELVKRKLDEVICQAMPLVDPALLDSSTESTNSPEAMPPLRPDQVPDYVPAYNDGIISLQSLPGATGVLYIDYRGGSTPTWGGITYDKPSVSNAQIKDVWKRVAEDYIPFNINVTTDIKVYQAAPENSRQRCICTPTTTASPGNGGVSFMNSWNWTGDTPNWSFYSTGKSAAEVISHECGHCLGLSHDGRTAPYNEVYYGGQGSGVTGWAPIMGAGYYQPVVQWSKGEYAYANQSQDDLNIIVSNNNNVDYRTDDTGSTLATARYMEIYTNSTAFAEGVIETTGDCDAFRFTTTGGTMSLTASPVGDWGNIAIMATLADATDTIIASNNPQNVLTASITTNLSAGTYTFRVTGVGRNDPLTNGFSAYNSLGYYSITGTIASARQSTRFTLDENSTNGTQVGIVDATNLGIDALTYTIISGNTSNTFALDNNGVLTVANTTMLDYEALSKNNQLAVQLEIFVNITNTVHPELTELNRRVLVQINDINETPSVTCFTNTILTHAALGTVAGTVQASDPDAYSLLTLSIISGNSNSVFSLDNVTGNISVAGDLNMDTQSVYNLVIQVTDNGTPALSATNIAQITIIPNASPFRPGTISYAVYDNIDSGVYVSNLTGNSRFPIDPTWEKQILTAEGDTSRADNYGSVLRGYLIPPVSGNYNFYIATDDNGELWMSTTTNPVNMTRIADITGGASYAGVQQWNKYTSQKSALRSLVAGQAYYMEARQKEGGGGDNLAVGWAGPATGGQTNVIPAFFLAPYLVNYTPHLIGFTNTVRRDAISGSRVGMLGVTDVNSNDTHSFAIIAGNDAGIFGVESNGWIYVASDTALAASIPANFTLTASATDNGVPALAGTNTVSISITAADILPATQLYREMFNSIGSGTLVSDLTNSVKFPGRPDALVAFTNFASAVDVADNYGSRIRACLVPSVSGDYKFFIASDDNSLLKFSRDTNAANAVNIASVSSWTATNAWSALAGQSSYVISNLVAGQRYFIEALQKEGGGGDHVEVAWLVPGTSVTNVIPGTNLQPVDLNYPPQFAAQAFSMIQNADNGTLVGRIAATDSPLDTLTFKITGGNSNSTFSLDPATGDLSVADRTLIAGGVVPSFALMVMVQDSGYGGLYPRQSSTNIITIEIMTSNGLAWDTSKAIGLQDGYGNWGGAPTNWWNGTTNVTWSNSLVAFFGAGTATNCTVTITNDVSPSGIVFNPNAGGLYTLASGGGGLNFSGSPFITANADAIINASIKGVAFIKNGQGTLTLAGTNIFTGQTIVSNGTLLVNRVLTTNSTSSLSVAINGTLGGTGLINSATTVQDGGTLSPGNAGIGRLIISNSLSLSAGSRTFVELSRNGGVPTNDLVVVSGTLLQGGTLVVTNITTNALVLGDSFRLFNAATNAGDFTNFNLPSLGIGLSWTTSSLAGNGTIIVTNSTYTLTYSAATNGTLSGSTNQTVTHGNSGSAVTAVPSPGFVLKNWIDGLTNNPRTDASVTNNISVIASFIWPSPPVVVNMNMTSGQNLFTLSGTGGVGQTYALLSTSNLLPPQVWTPVAIGTGDINGAFFLIDLESTNYAQRYYRIQTR